MIGIFVENLFYSMNIIGNEIIMGKMVSSDFKCTDLVSVNISA